MVDFAFDHLCNPNKGYPNLSLHRPQPYTPGWRQFDLHWPNVVPLRLLMYLDDLGLGYGVWPADWAPDGSIYPIAFSWFDFQMDYVELIPAATRHRISQGTLHLLFYYHEGDNPSRIRAQLDQQCQRHGIPPEHTLFISANSAAAGLDRCIYFDDFECWLWSLNRSQSPKIPVSWPSKDFTLLSRSNKSWRACVVHDLYSRGLLDHSQWSYASDSPMIDDPADNPLEWGDQWSRVKEFLDNGPYRCDQFDSNEQNDHHMVNDNLYQETKFHIVLETHLDADGSGGCFITEKTYKCIKYRQPFLVIGTPGTLACLREHGYRVFDHVIDNSYDLETDNTKRWRLLSAEILRLKLDIENAWKNCQGDCEHNARLFGRRPAIAVNNLMQEIKCRL